MTNLDLAAVVTSMSKSAITASALVEWMNKYIPAPGSDPEGTDIELAVERVAVQRVRRDARASDAVGALQRMARTLRSADRGAGDEETDLHSVESAETRREERNAERRERRQLACELDERIMQNLDLATVVFALSKTTITEWALEEWLEKYIPTPGSDRHDAMTQVASAVAKMTLERVWQDPQVLTRLEELGQLVHAGVTTTEQHTTQEE